ncbi:MAG: hypothetical protein ACRD88_05585, partial [Terriglobia bacterium]
HQKCRLKSETHISGQCSIFCDVFHYKIVAAWLQILCDPALRDRQGTTVVPELPQNQWGFSP